MLVILVRIIVTTILDPWCDDTKMLSLNHSFDSDQVPAD